MATLETSQRAEAGQPSAGSHLDRVPNAVWTALIAACSLALLEYAVRGGFVSSMILAAPSDVFNALIDGFSRGIYPRELGSTLGSAGMGFLLAFVVSFTIAGLLASSSRAEAIFYPFVVAFQSLPKVAIAPLVVIWLGFNDVSKVVIVMIICFFPMLVNNLQGLKVRDRTQHELFKALGASKIQYFLYLRTPSALPFVFAGLRISTVFALIGAIVAEFVGSRHGIGKVLLYEKSAFNVPGVFAVLVLLMIVGICLHLVTAFLERRLMFWAREIDVRI
jgi:NitT/TauT family transport system permease protein